MSLSALKEKILLEAAADAEQITREHDRVLQDKQERTVQELRALEEGIVADAKKEAERQVRIIHQQAELAGRSMILQAKQEELQATKEAFLSLLTKCTNEEKKAIQSALQSLVPKGDGKIVEDASGIGFVFQGDGIEMNLTRSHIVDELFRKYRAEIANELFN